MSFVVACIGTLMANTRLSDLLKSAFRGVEKMLSGKDFPQNKRALRICLEEILWSILQDESILDFDSMIILLNFFSQEKQD